MKRRILRTACAALLILNSLTCTAVSANETALADDTLPEEMQIPGDCNHTGTCDEWDADAVRSWLLNAYDLERSAWQNADLDQNQCLNAVDLTLLKRQLLEDNSFFSYADISGKELIEPPVRAVNPTMPGTGNVRIPVFAVSFPDCESVNPLLETFLADCCFGQRDILSFNYPLESISAYFGRASYGRFQLSGDVMHYQTEHPIGYYASDNGRQLMEEILSAYDREIDYRTYDADNNRILDAAVIVLPETAQKIDNDGDRKPDWWPFTISDNSDAQFDGVQVGTYCVGIWSDHSDEFVNKMSHELCHAMGLPDYYVAANGNAFDEESMQGKAGCELMDEGTGDLSAFSKLLLGWLAEDEIQIYTGGSQTFELTSMQQKPSCVIIPRNPDDGFLSEFFLIEYITGEANNSAYFRSGRPQPLYEKYGGVRILHCQAEVAEGYFGPEFKYSNHSRYYDASGEKERVLRLVNGYDFISGTNSRNKFFTSLLPEFCWYDEAGGLTVNTGIKTSVYGPSPGPAFDIDNMEYMVMPGTNLYCLPSFLNDSTFEIVITPYDSSVDTVP